MSLSEAGDNARVLSSRARIGGVMEKRAPFPRVGIVLLNLLASGLGLLRLGFWKMALVLCSISFIALIILDYGPSMPFVALVAVLVLGLLSFLTALVLSWQRSRERKAQLPWYAQWYSVLGAAIVSVLASLLLRIPEQRYRSFYMPSEAMDPTLPKMDRFIAYMGPLGTLRRGDLVLVRTHTGPLYVKRVAALDGDRFSMKNGVVILNGVAVTQRPLGLEIKQWSGGPQRAQRLAERFPGEISDHEIYDAGPSPQDEVPEVKVPHGAVYLLGDNRDFSADSRIPTEFGGLGGPVRDSDVVGRPDFQSWGSSRPIGTRLF
jgi:signal peptidase I